MSYNKRMKRRISTNKKYKILQLYYEGESANTICRDYHIAHSTLYKWITDYPKESIILANIKKEKPINITRMISHTQKVEAELDFLHRTVRAATEALGVESGYAKRM